MRQNALLFLLVFYYRNLASFSDASTKLILDAFIDGLRDDNLEVRNTAAKVFAGVLRSSQRSQIPGLRVSFHRRRLPHRILTGEFLGSFSGSGTQCALTEEIRTQLCRVNAYPSFRHIGSMRISRLFPIRYRGVDAAFDGRWITMWMQDISCWQFYSFCKTLGGPTADLDYNSKHGFWFQKDASGQSTDFFKPALTDLGCRTHGKLTSSRLRRTSYRRWIQSWWGPRTVSATTILQRGECWWER